MWRTTTKDWAINKNKRKRVLRRYRHLCHFVYTWERIGWQVLSLLFLESLFLRSKWVGVDKVGKINLFGERENGGGRWRERVSRTRKDFYSLIESSAYLKPMISYRVRWSCAGMFLRHLLAECLEHQELVAERGRERELGEFVYAWSSESSGAGRRAERRR